MNATDGYRTVSTRTVDLTLDERGAMHALLDAHFEGVSREIFTRDLDAKDWALRIFSGERLVGFSTLAASVTQDLRGRDVNVIYSGDTIMSPEAWRTSALAKGWITLVRRVQAALGPRPCYWLLLSSGFRTYRFLPVFWRHFWPRYDVRMSDEETVLRDFLAGGRFAKLYDPRDGVVRFPSPQKLRASLSAVPDGRTENDPHIAFFLQSNPGWREGDELVCVAPLGDENLTPAGRRIVRAAGL
jgi:hypothetical protein